MRFVKLILTLLVACIVLANSQVAIGENNTEWTMIADFEADESWAGSGDSADTIFYVEGSQGRRLTASWGAEAWSTLNESMNLAVVDQVYIAFYVEDSTKTAKITIELWSDSNNIYYYSWSPLDYVSGWNYKFLEESDFVYGDMPDSTVPDWANINALRVRILGSAPVSSSFVTFDDWQVFKTPTTQEVYLPIIFNGY